MKRTCPTAKTGGGEVRTRLTTWGRMMLRSFEIRSDLALQDRAAVEVVLRLNDGRSRWCYFLTPQALTNCGDWIDGTTTSIHYNAPYMIVVSGRLDEGMIERALRHIDSRGDLEVCSRLLDADPLRIASPEWDG